MATSGTTSYSVTELEVITDSMQSIGALGSGSIAPEDYAVCRRKLNMIVKQWVSQADFAPGLKMWTRRRGYLFLQKDQVQYSLGPTGDNATESYVSTTLSVAAVVSDATVTVTTVAGISTTMFIGIEMDSGSIHWTTVNGAPAGSVVTLTAVMAGAAAIGNRVFAYTTKLRKPFEIITASLRDTDDQDSPVDPHLSVGEYESIGDKTNEGTPCGFYFEPQATTARVFLNSSPDDVTKVLRLRYLSYIEDLTATTETVDLPQEWFRPLSAQLSIDICEPLLRKPASPGLKTIRDEALAIARNAYPETSESFFEGYAE